MEQQTALGVADSPLAQCLRRNNQRYLDRLQHSGDPLDVRSKLLATILDCAADGLIVFDEKLTVVLANLAAAQIAGWQLEDVTRDELHRKYKFYYDEGQTAVPYDQEPIAVALREKRSYEMEGYVVSEHLSEKGFWVRAHAAPLFDNEGNVVGGVTIFSDISERKKLQSQRDCLASLIAHDIKNHLAAEQAFFDLMLEEGRQEDSLDVIMELKSASAKFLGIAESLVEMSRARFFADTSYAQDIEVIDLINQVVEKSSLSAITRKVTIAIKCSSECPIIRGLPGVVGQVLYNVVQNAIEASPIGALVTVSVSADSTFVHLSVADNGAGMSAEDVSKLFSPHRVAGHVVRTTHSSGFGLYLSFLLIEEQAGTITCTSELGAGTVLTIKLPRSSRGRQ